LREGFKSVSEGSNVLLTQGWQLSQGSIRHVARANIFRAWANQFVVGVVFEDVPGPAVDADAREAVPFVAHQETRALSRRSRKLANGHGRY